MSKISGPHIIPVIAEKVPSSNDARGRELYSDEYLIALLQRLNEDLGRAPTVDDIRNLSEVMPDVSTYERRFGLWTKALEAAGIEGAHNTSDETLLRRLAGLILKLGRNPSKREVDACPDVASTGTYRSRFGSHTVALALANEKIDWGSKTLL